MKLSEIKRDILVDWIEQNLSAWDLEKQKSVLGAELTKYLIASELVLPSNIHVGIGQTKNALKLLDSPITFSDLNGLTIHRRKISSFNIFKSIGNLSLYNCELDTDLSTLVESHHVNFVDTHHTMLSFNDVEKMLQMDLDRFVYSVGTKCIVNATLAGIHVMWGVTEIMLDDVFEFQDFMISNGYDKDPAKFKQ
ncbi:hypothetical protein RsoM2USA_274 [Ralstonia phage RsoM2USA]|nr:hypothetical protein RsoM2USA_274 [Ralstonia phage RsoM2USA]